MPVGLDHARHYFNALNEFAVPDKDKSAFRQMEHAVGEDAAAAALEFTKLCLAFWPDASLSDMGEDRAHATVGTIFDSPSVTLSHGRVGPNSHYTDIIGANSGNEDNVTCAPWLGDSRRKVLLAQVGVGTIDQAFLSVLPTKHDCMRNWGPSRNIHMVDEAHELGNPYMVTELEAICVTAKFSCFNRNCISKQFA